MSWSTVFHLHAVAVAYASDNVDAFSRALDALKDSLDDESWPPEPLDLTRQPLIGLAALYNELCSPESQKSEIARWAENRNLEGVIQSLVERKALKQVGDEGPLAAGEGIVPVLLPSVGGWSALARLPLREQSVDAAEQVSTGEHPGEIVGAVTAARADVSRVLESAELDWKLPNQLGAPAAGVGSSVPHPSTVQINLALAFLAQMIGLPYPAESCIIAVGQPMTGRYEEEPDNDLRAAAEKAGWNAAVIEDGQWKLGNFRARGTDLMALAKCVWPNFDAELRRWDRDRILTQTRWTIEGVARRGEKFPKGGVPTTGAPWFAEPKSPVVPVNTSAVLAGAFRACPLAARVLSGRRNSGKSTIARAVAAQLHSNNWNVLVVRPESRSLSADMDLADIIAVAIESARLTNWRNRTLVVIEDLLPIDFGELGIALSEAAAANGVAILALAQYGRGSAVDWETETVSPINAIQTRGQVRELAIALLERKSSGFRLPPGWTMDDLLDRSQLDLHVLTRILSNVHNPLGTPSRNVRNLMALALIDESVPSDALPPTDREMALNWGAVEERGYIGFPARATAQERERMEEHLPEAIAWVLQIYGATGDERARYVVRSLVAAVPDIVESALADERVAAGLDEWLERCDTAAGIDVLGVFQRAVGVAPISERLDKAVARLASAQVRISPSSLNRISRVLDERERLRSESGGLDAFVEWLEGRNGLKWSLDGGASFFIRVRLAQTLLRLGHTDVAQVMADNLEGFLQQIDSQQTRDLRGLHEMTIVIRRLRSRLRRHGADKLPPELGAMPIVASILARGPGPDAGFPELVTWLALRTRPEAGYVDWDSYLETYTQRLISGLTTAVGREVSKAISHLSTVNRGFSNRLLNEMRMAGPLGTSLSEKLAEVLVRETPPEAATLLRTLANVHFAVAKDVLYEGENPRTGLAQKLALGVRQSFDVKGAGMLLNASRKIDAIHSAYAGTFANQLAEQIGGEFVARALAQENRPSVLIHFVEGLWAADASYREDVRDRALQLAVSGIRRPSGRVSLSAPRLVLLLVDDERFGHEVLRYLREHITVELLMQHLTSRFCPLDSLVALHRVTRTLYPAHEAQLFGNTSDFAWSIPPAVAAARASTLADYLRELAQTIQLAGVADPALMIRQWLAGNAEFGQHDHPGAASYWARRLNRMTYEPAAAAHTLNSLALFDIRLAEEVVYLLDKPTEVEVGVQDLSTATTPLQRLVRNSTGDADAFVSLLRAIDKTRPGLGPDLLNDLRNAKVQLARNTTVEFVDSIPWKEFLENYRFEQDAVTQLAIGARLSRLSFDSTSADARNIFESLVQNRWLPTIPFVASPQVVASMLRIANLWNPVWAQQLATQVNMTRLGARFRKGWIADLNALPQLLRAMQIARPSVLSELTEFLPMLEAARVELGERMPLDALASLLALGEPLPEPTREKLALDLSRRLKGELERVALLNPSKHWSSVGYGCSVLERSGRLDLVPTLKPDVKFGIGVPGQFLWATSWHGSDAVWRDELKAVWADYLARSGLRLSGEERAMALVGGLRSQLLQSAEVVADEAEWGGLISARLSTLAAVWRLGDELPEFSAWLAKLEGPLRSRLAAPGMSVYDGHQELTARLGTVGDAAKLTKEEVRLLQ